MKMNAPRLDRWLTLSVAARLARWRERRGTIPILMYHSIADDVDDTVHPYFRTVTTPAAFARQIGWLRDNGYESVSLAEAAHPAQGADTPPPRKVALTFDDGFRDFRTAALPILERAGFGATVFLSTAYLGKPFLTGRPCLAAHEVKALAEAGIEFGSHSVSHRRLVDLPRDELAREIVDSRRTIEDITGKEVAMFSYPYRFPEEQPVFTRTLADLLDASGYRLGVTTAIGCPRAADDRRFLPRLPVNDCDDIALLQAKLEGHYDWLRPLQRLRKQSRATLARWRRR
jgi:peptidoglycan/xylan/chitin deacetylase (PgdA/CDA1 family)